MTAPLPNACTLGPDDGAARLRRQPGPPAQRQSTTRSDGGDLIEVRYADGPAIRAELEGGAGDMASLAALLGQAFPSAEVEA